MQIINTRLGASVVLNGCMRKHCGGPLSVFAPSIRDSILFLGCTEADVSQVNAHFVACYETIYDLRAFIKL